jgi:hypothetical protein
MLKAEYEGDFEIDFEAGELPVYLSHGTICVNRIGDFRQLIVESLAIRAIDIGCGDKSLGKILYRSHFYLSNAATHWILSATPMQSFRFASMKRWLDGPMRWKMKGVSRKTPCMALLRTLCRSS